ncbi:SDR family oxidoreductase [Arenibacter algicola]|uniref:SDR family NAD(P)-dependent oxidoreductase n=1 Tax=Arenibacter algicola TaxID=616991 RepID=UPI001C076394|nr:SDR family NAD(P)-dependent oxidoreductase [Arenibacter algicola]MBU2904089.1 SDR family oxidoreductase [Arenibacter algicola]
MGKEIRNQIGIITGAASGIGSAIALRLSEKGVKLALFDCDKSGLKKIKSLLSTECETYIVDITDEKEVAKWINKVGERFGKIDILINSAGITGETNIKSHEVNSDDLRRVFEVNFMGSYYTSKYVLPWMLKNNYGRILHIASISGKEGNAGMLAYSASKAAVIGMAKVQGKEYAEKGITINTLAPAVIKTAMVDALPNEQVNYMTDKIPMKRCGTLTEVADIATFIVSPECSFTSGFTFDLSGGRATY